MNDYSIRSQLRLRVGRYELVPFKEINGHEPTYWAWYGGKPVTLDDVKQFAKQIGVRVELYETAVLNTVKGHNE